MKKALAIFLTLAMALTLCLPAFADNKTGNTVQSPFSICLHGDQNDAECTVTIDDNAASLQSMSLSEVKKMLQNTEIEIDLSGLPVKSVSISKAVLTLVSLTNIERFCVIFADGKLEFTAEDLAEIASSAVDAAVSLALGEDADEDTVRALFTDVMQSDWFCESVNYCLQKGLMNGTGDTTFSPDENATRAMIWAILARSAGTEISGEHWAEDAREWAVNAGISDGSNPDGNITREELATMLYRVVKNKGKGFVGAWMFLLDAPDADTISSWADEALHWCVMNQIIGGDETGALHPGENATRAEVARMLQSFSGITL